MKYVKDGYGMKVVKTDMDNTEQCGEPWGGMAGDYSGGGNVIGGISKEGSERIGVVGAGMANESRDGESEEAGDNARERRAAIGFSQGTVGLMRQETEWIRCPGR